IYVGMLTTLGLSAIRKGGWKGIGIVGIVCGVGAGLFDIREDLAILRTLDLPLRQTTHEMIDAIRIAAITKWSLVTISSAVLLANVLRAQVVKERRSQKR